MERPTTTVNVFCLYQKRSTLEFQSTLYPCPGISLLISLLHMILFPVCSPTLWYVTPRFQTQNPFRRDSFSLKTTLDFLTIYNRPRAPPQTTRYPYIPTLTPQHRPVHPTLFLRKSMSLVCELMVGRLLDPLGPPISSSSLSFSPSFVPTPVRHHLEDFGKMPKPYRTLIILHQGRPILH